MRQTLRDKLKQKYYLIKPLSSFIILLTKWQNSNFLPLRLLGKFLALAIFFILKDDYFKIIMFIRKMPNYKHCTSSAIPQLFFINAITSCNKATVEEYRTLLGKVTYTAEMQKEWARRFIEIGRLDLAREGFLQLVSRREHQLPLEQQPDVHRHLGAVCFMLGKNDEANYYWQLAGQLRRALFKPNTPKNYRILGPAWFAAIGHVAMLSYYLKFKKLHGELNARIVAQWENTQAPGQYLLSKFAELGITFIKPGTLEKDYNTWAKKFSIPKWSQLSPEERSALIDDFWEYEFPDGETLGYTHATARIEKEWKKLGRPALLSLTKQEKNWIANYLQNLGVPKDAWYVCLHVREAGFHKAWNALYPSMRDCNIDDYYDAIQAIVNAGGWVLRMGDPSMKPLPPMEHVVDYAHSFLKTPTADILLAAGCRFFLGTNSGYATISEIYNVPCALTNWVPIGWPLWSEQDLMIPKLFRNKTTKAYFTLEQIFERGLAFLQNWSDLSSEIELVPNSAEEITQVALEMLAFCGLSKHKIFITEQKWQEAQKHYAELARRYGTFTGSRIAKSFVEKYAELFLSPPLEQTSLTTSKGNDISWQELSKDNMTVTLT